MLITVGLSSCLTGLVDRDRREDRDITLSDFNILLSDTDNRLELSKDTALSLGTPREAPSPPMFCPPGSSRCLVSVSSTCTQPLSFSSTLVEWCEGACLVVWAAFFLSESWEEWLPLCLSESEDECGLECLAESAVEWEPLCFRDSCEVWDLHLWWGQGSWDSGVQGDWSAGTEGGGGAGLCFFLKWISTAKQYLNKCYQWILNAMQHHFTHLTAKGMLIVTSLCKFTATGLQSHLTLYFTFTLQVQMNTVTSFYRFTNYNFILYNFTATGLHTESHHFKT